MPSIHVRNLDDAIIAALKKRAKLHQRSLEGELRQVLETAAFASEAFARGQKLPLKTVNIGHPVVYNREVIYDESEP